MKPQEGPWPAKLALCIDVEDLAESRKKIVDPGGTIDVEQVDMPGIGSMILFEDPDGRVIGLWKQQGQPTED
jgi:predicted enzyme related to lactoylglutathione lyase